jgi:serine/threonine-protein kinase RsbW
VTVAAGEEGLELRVGRLRPDGARALLRDAELPGVGNVFERVADEVRAGASPSGDGDELVLRLRFAT